MHYKNEILIFIQNKAYASLAVDALFFKPDAKVHLDGSTSGFIENPKLYKPNIKASSNSYRSNFFQ